MNIAAFRPFSLSDYPGKIAAIAFTQGCNFNCFYCHNPGLIPLTPNTKFGDTGIHEEKVLTFLQQRRGKLDGLVITGGEPTLQEGLLPFMSAVKSQDYFIKLDTNGSFPETLKAVLKAELVDYIAMDIKAPLEKYNTIVKNAVSQENILKSIQLIMASGIDYEFRTTVVSTRLSSQDLIECGRLIQGAKRYILQKYVPIHLSGQEERGEQGYTEEELREVLTELNRTVKHCYLR